MATVFLSHYDDATMGAMTCQITSLTIVCSTVYSGTDQSKHQSSASLAFVRGIHRGPVNSPHKWPVTRKMFPFDDVIMEAPGASGSEWFGCAGLVGSQIEKVQIFVGVAWVSPVGDHGMDRIACVTETWKLSQGWFQVCARPMRDGVTL